MTLPRYELRKRESTDDKIILSNFFNVRSPERRQKFFFCVRTKKFEPPARRTIGRAAIMIDHWKRKRRRGKR